jgi:uncharacterized OB-fold protein
MNKTQSTAMAETKAYHEALARGEITIQRCRKCDRKQHYPRPFCLECLSIDVVLEPIPARATLYAFTINHVHSNPAFKAALPFVTALVEVADGVRIMARLIDIEPLPEAVRIGMVLEPVKFSDPAGSAIPAFRPVSPP